MSVQEKMPPSQGLKLSLEVLAKTQNEAAVSVLIPALDSHVAAINEGALRAILDRRSPAGQREILRRLDSVSPRWKAILDERRGRLTHALRDAVLGNDAAMCTNACQAILWFREHDLLPALIAAAEKDSHAHGDLAAQTLMALANLLYEELSNPREHKDRRDPQIIRRNATSALEASVKRFVKHRRAEVTTAFLVLAARDNATLKQILQDPRDPSYLSLVDGLLHSTRGGVIRLLLSFLDDPHAPSAAITVLSRRGDRRFIDHLLRKVGFEPSTAASQNIKRMETIAWLKGSTKLLDELDDAQQHSVVRIYMLSGAKRAEVYKTIEHLVRFGKPGGRRAAAEALAQFNGAQANALALEALSDEDPKVQAAVAGQLRQRGIPGGLNRLIELLDSPHEVVRSAAGESLVEFNFERFLSAFDMLDPEVRQSTGALVKKVNPQAIPALEAELKSRSRTRRLRGLGVAAAMDAVAEVEAAVLELLKDDDHMVRADAARALAQCDQPATMAALQEALGDRSVSVQEAAEQSLQALKNRQSGNRWERLL